METIELSRKQLYEIVWSTPISQLAEKYVVSRYGIKTICKKYEIPLPQNGYWSKLKFNKPVEKEDFNYNYIGEDKIVMTLREEGNEVSLDQTPLTILTKQIFSDKNAPLIVPEKITNPDILTIRTKGYWINESKDKHYHDHSLFILPIRVEKNNKDRALKFMDTLIKLIRYRGHDIIKDNHETMVIVDGTKIVIDLREATKRIPSAEKWRTSDYVPTGEFILKTGKQWRMKEWRDGNLKLEDQLAKIIAKLEIDAQKEKVFQEEIRFSRLKHEDEKQREEAIKKRNNDELAKCKELLDLSKQYNNSLLIRQFVEAKKQQAIKANNLTQETQEWIKWANDKADWYDPTINKPDDI